MKINEKRKLMKLVLIGGLFFLICTAPVLAQEVPHHGHMVEMSDPEDCLACHDGAMAGNVIPCPEINCTLNSQHSHSVFREYPPVGKEADFNPAHKVKAAGIRLKDGQVTCISCHDLANQDRYHLVMENGRSRLCRTCHIR